MVLLLEPLEQLFVELTFLSEMVVVTLAGQFELVELAQSHHHLMLQF